MFLEHVPEHVLISKKELNRHMKSCTDVQKVDGKELCFGSQDDVASQIREFINLDFDFSRQTHFCVYDIETFDNGGILTPVSIAIASTMEGPRYFERANSSLEAGVKMVKDFMRYLDHLQNVLVTCSPTEVEQALEVIVYELENASYECKQSLRGMYTYLKKYHTLKTFGFNSRNI